MKQFEEEEYAEIRKREKSRENVDSQLNDVLESGRQLYVSFLIPSCFFFFFFQTYQVKQFEEEEYAEIRIR